MLTPTVNIVFLTKAQCWEAVISLFLIFFINDILREVNHNDNSSDISAHPPEDPFLFPIVFSLAPP